MCDTSIVVFDVPSGKEIATFVPTDSKYGGPYAKQFTVDGKLLLDSSCTVWDIDTGVRRFSVPNIYYNSSLFSRSGRELIVVATSSDGCYLAYYDVATGPELVDRRVPARSRHWGDALRPCDGGWAAAPGRWDAPQRSTQSTCQVVIQDSRFREPREGSAGTRIRPRRGSDRSRGHARQRLDLEAACRTADT